MDVKPRVLFVVGFLSGNEGISVGLVRLAKGLKGQGWEVALASAMPENPDPNLDSLRGSQWFESYGIKHFYVPFPDLYRSRGHFTDSFKALQKLSIAVSQFKPDIINVHSLSLCPYVQLIQFLYKIPYVTTARAELATHRLGVKLGAFVNQYFSTFLGSRFIAISTEIKKDYEHKLKVPKHNIRLICHGVESEHFRPPSLQERLDVRQEFGLADESKVVCFIGRLSHVKGCDILIQAISLLKAEGYQVPTLYAGKSTPEEEASICNSLVEEGIDNLVRLLGWVDSRKVLWASDILVLPSRREGFGWVIPEAMLCGVVPLRTPSAGAIDQIEDGVNGFIIPFNDPQALAARIKQLLENDELRQKMAEAAIESARQKFTADRMIQQTITVYEEVINSHQHRRIQKDENFNQGNTDFRRFI